MHAYIQAWIEGLINVVVLQVTNYTIKECLSELDERSNVNPISKLKAIGCFKKG